MCASIVIRRFLGLIVSALLLTATVAITTDRATPAKWVDGFGHDHVGTAPSQVPLGDGFGWGRHRKDIP
ncbi:hypothetical protein Rhe02_58050 [Rhizocola hellebori]|uniref:Uncharacterized protein n=1 Tax=Rhizocola hellebori TaxID=1392758 RepID=A0A8J3VJ82_9ACTN|nr:hypothetical protein Rhe02_58050 [Rhizocola hellebori]